jgi:hypothetical protein
MLRTPVSRPFHGLRELITAVPALKCWATLSRPPGGLRQSNLFSLKMRSVAGEETQRSLIEVSTVTCRGPMQDSKNDDSTHGTACGSQRLLTLSQARMTQLAEPLAVASGCYTQPGANDSTPPRRFMIR